MSSPSLPASQALTTSVTEGSRKSFFTTANWSRVLAVTLTLNRSGRIGSVSRRHFLYCSPYASGGASSARCPSAHVTVQPSPTRAPLPRRCLPRALAMSRPTEGFSATMSLMRRSIREESGITAVDCSRATWLNGSYVRVGCRREPAAASQPGPVRRLCRSPVGLGCSGAGKGAVGVVGGALHGRRGTARRRLDDDGRHFRCAVRVLESASRISDEHDRVEDQLLQGRPERSCGGCLSPAACRTLDDSGADGPVRRGGQARRADDADPGGDQRLNLVPYRSSIAGLLWWEPSLAGSIE